MERKNIMKNGLMVDKFGDKCWYKDDLLHRTNGPAVIYSDGTEAWWVEGKRHRIGGPAVIDGMQLWYFNEGKLHRTDGPAFIGADGSEKWFLDNKELTHKEWLAAVSSSYMPVVPVISSSVSINDHTCPTCKNDRCSKTEKSCWKCGNSL
jgi:hypothetical protein